MASDTKKLAGECDLYNISLSAVGITIYIHKTIVCMLYSLLFIVLYNRIDYFFLKVESTPAGRMCTICSSASVPFHINKSHEKYFVVFCLKSLKFQNFLSNLMNMHARTLACFFRSSIYFRNVLLFVF